MRETKPHSRLAIASFVLGALSFALLLVLVVLLFWVDDSWFFSFQNGMTSTIIVLLALCLLGSASVFMGIAAFFQKDRSYVLAIPGIVLGGFPMGMAIEWGLIFGSVAWVLR